MSFVTAPDGNGCTLWRGCINSRGYGVFSYGGKGKSVLAHRWACEHLGERPIPEGMTVDHLCRQRRCVNHEHLDVVTNKTNILRGESPTAHNARATHCINGHPFDEANTFIRSDGRRRCITCRREDNKRRRSNSTSRA